MNSVERQEIDPHFRERRERIATSILAELIGSAGEYREKHLEIALHAADELIDAVDSASM